MERKGRIWVSTSIRVGTVVRVRERDGVKREKKGCVKKSKRRGREVEIDRARPRGEGWRVGRRGEGWCEDRMRARIHTKTRTTRYVFVCSNCICL